MIHNLTNELDTYEIPLLIADKQFLAEGHYGIVYTIQCGMKKYALKIFKEDMLEVFANTDGFNYDYDILKDLQGSSYFPTLHAYQEGKWMISEFVYGDPLRFSEKPTDYTLDLIEAFQFSVKRSWFPHDVKGDNILICDNSDTLMIIDVGEFIKIHGECVVNMVERAIWVIDNCHRRPSVLQSLPGRIYLQNKA